MSFAGFFILIITRRAIHHKMQRKTRVTITKSLIEQVERNIHQGKTLKEIAESLLLSYVTVRRIAKKLQEVDNYAANFTTMYKRRSRRISNENIGHIITGIIDNKNDYIQSELKEDLSNMSVNISQPTISREIKKVKYTRKRLTKIPVERNTPQMIDTRRSYARSMAHIRDENLIFLDECGFNRHTSRAYGYSPVNQKAVKFVNGNRGNNISLLCMIKINGSAQYEIHNGAINAQILTNFLQNKLAEYTTGNKPTTLILDNVRFHHSQIVKEICKSKRVSIKYLPAYSPQLNPIEEFFSTVKSRYHAQNGPKNTFAKIKSSIKVSIFSIEQHIYFNLFANMRRWIDKAVACELFI